MSAAASVWRGYFWSSLRCVTRKPQGWLSGQPSLLKNDQIRKIKENRYGVRSQTAGSVEHAVQKTARGWSCSCLDYRHRMAYCKHICAVRLLQGDVPADAPKAASVERDTMVVRPVGDIPEGCKWCGKPDIVKKGPREAQYSKPDTSSSTAATTAGGDLSSGRDSRGCGTIRNMRARWKGRTATANSLNGNADFVCMLKLALMLVLVALVANSFRSARPAAQVSHTTNSRDDVPEHACPAESLTHRSPSMMNKCVRTATIRYVIEPSVGNGLLELQFLPSTEFAGEQSINNDNLVNQRRCKSFSPNL